MTKTAHGYYATDMLSVASGIPSEEISGEGADWFHGDTADRRKWMRNWNKGRRRNRGGTGIEKRESEGGEK